MTCAVLQRDRHEGEVRTAGAPGEHPMTGRYQLQPTVFVDAVPELAAERRRNREDRKSTRLNSSHSQISYAVFCLKKKKKCYTHISTTHIQSRKPTHISSRQTHGLHDC